MRFLYCVKTPHEVYFGCISATNRDQAQQMLEQRYRNIAPADRKIDVMPLTDGDCHGEL